MSELETQRVLGKLETGYEDLSRRTRHNEDRIENHAGDLAGLLAAVATVNLQAQRVPDIASRLESLESLRSAGKWVLTGIILAAGSAGVGLSKILEHLAKGLIE